MFKPSNSLLIILTLVVVSLVVVLFGFSCAQLPTMPSSAASPSTQDLIPSPEFEESNQTIANRSVIPDSVTEEEYPEYRLKVDGLVDRPLTLSYKEILQYPSISNNLVLVCPGLFQERAEWTGVPVKLILEEAGIKPEAKQVTFYGSDNYRYTLPLERMEDDSVFLAYIIDGRVMKEEDGGPVRVVAQGELGSAWVQFLVHIEVI